MEIAGTWNLPANQASGVNFAFAPVPAFRGYENKVATSTGGWNLGINANSNKKESSAVLVKWLTIGEGNDMLIDLTHHVPSSVSYINKIQSNPNMALIDRIATFETSNTSYPRALTPGFPEYQTVMDAMWEDVRNGSDVRGSLDSAVRQLNMAFSKYK